MNQKQIPDYSIYAVIDRTSIRRALLSRVVKACIRANVEIIQLRDKTEDAASFYKSALWARKVVGDKALFIINDRADIARLVEADGLHLGQSDIPVRAARKIIGAGKIIGKSCHSLKEALLAQREGADYISIGPVFATPTKPEYQPVGLRLLKKACSFIKIPIVAIGGINTGNAFLLPETGVKIVAVVRAVCQERDIVQSVAQLRWRAFGMSG